MSPARTIAKRGLVEVAARVAPLTWRWRKPGSLVVLMYHRVLPVDSLARRTEQPGMYVSPETLDMHLTEIASRFELMHLDDWLRRAEHAAPLPRLACAITFDDGWRDNYEHALPILERHCAPATIFLVADFIGTNYRFWPNRLLSLLEKEWACSGSVVFPEPLRPVVEPVLARARRRGEFRPEEADEAVCAAKRFDEGRIRELILAAEQGCPDAVLSRDIVSTDEIVRMAATDLIRFGSHTATHFRLGGDASPEDLRREIVLSRDPLRQICGQEIEVFCYPNGETSPVAIDQVRRHYLGAVTTRPGWQTPSGDRHLVRRIGVHEDVSRTPESFLARLSAWL